MFRPVDHANFFPDDESSANEPALLNALRRTVDAGIKKV
jgi:hypothetical protein